MTFDDVRAALVTLLSQPIEEIRAALVTLLSQPVAVASVVVLAGIHAAIWFLVFERVGFPPVLASLMIVPPLTFLLPLYVALARWPSQRLARFPRHAQNARTRAPQPSVQRQSQPHHPHPQQQRASRPVMTAFAHSGPVRLASDGLPRVRIPLPPPIVTADWPGMQPVEAAYSPRTALWPPETEIPARFGHAG